MNFLDKNDKNDIGSWALIQWNVMSIVRDEKMSE